LFDDGENNRANRNGQPKTKKHSFDDRIKHRRI
jgi:hypothetical protein